MGRVKGEGIKGGGVKWVGVSGKEWSRGDFKVDRS